jgi:hypothetical protein
VKVWPIFVIRLIDKQNLFGVCLSHGGRDPWIRHLFFSWRQDFVPFVEELWLSLLWELDWQWQPCGFELKSWRVLSVTMHVWISFDW